MALTYSALRPNTLGNQKEVSGFVALDSSYPTGGYAFSPAAIGLSNIDSLEADGRNGYIFTWDGSKTAPKLMAFQGDNANASPAPGVQVTNATNLSAVTNVRFVARGY